MEEQPDPSSVLQGVESAETKKLWAQVKKVRAYVRYSSQEGCFRSYSDSSSLEEGIAICWETLSQYERVLPAYNLSYIQVWLYPTLVLGILHRPGQFVTVRSHAVPTIAGVDISTARLLTLCSSLSSFFGAGQPMQFEEYIEGRARTALLDLGEQ